MTLSPPPRPWGDPRPTIAARDRPSAFRRAKRHIVPALTALFLFSGGTLHLVNVGLDSVVIAHTSRSAMIFGLVGLRRVQQSQIEEADAAESAAS